MKIKRKITISNLMMLIVPVLCIGAISLLCFFIFFTKYSLSNMTIDVSQLLSPDEFLRSVGERLLYNPAAMQYLILYLTLCIFIIVVVTAVLTHRLAGSISRPIENLKTAADNIRRGNLNFQVLGSEYEEIDELCRMFDDMRIQLKESKDQEAELLKERSMLLANLSHDLKTPVTSIKGYVEGLCDGIADTSEKREKYLETIYQKAEIIEDMVANLSLFSKLELSRIDFKFAMTDFNDFVIEMAEKYRLDFSRNQLRLILLPAPNPIMVKLDIEKMRRVFSNLFDNCIKYRSEGEGSVTVSVRTVDNGIYATVADTGIGIDETKLTAVFESFYRVDNARTMNIKGSGLGLGIVRQIVEKHGGKIWLKSGEGKGTTAVIYLPRNCPVSDDDTQ